MTARALLRWYEPRRSRYPWRRAVTPYRVLVSEVMLQQTQAARVAPAFRAFIRGFPSVRALAAAPRSEVVRAWAGLGYNRRAVALSEAARAVVRDHGGRVPSDLDALRALPGVGPYTASAVAAIAFGRPVAAVDTNVRRVVARSRLGVNEDETYPDDIRRAAEGWLRGNDPAAWNQAVMDLGREVCRPAPRCEACPIATWCRYRSAGKPGARRRRAASAPFEGSSRQLRGRIVSELRDHRTATISALVESTGGVRGDVASAVAALARDGVVTATAAALDGRPTGDVRLAT